MSEAGKGGITGTILQNLTVTAGENQAFPASEEVNLLISSPLSPRFKEI